MKNDDQPNLMEENSLNGFSVKRLPGDGSAYKIYLVTIGESNFIIRKSANHMWVPSDEVTKHGDEILNLIGNYIDDNSI